MTDTVSEPVPAVGVIAIQEIKIGPPSTTADQWQFPDTFTISTAKFRPLDGTKGTAAGNV
jgi:hypothetical protein